MITASASDAAAMSSPSPGRSGKVGIINQSTEAGWLPQIGGYKYLLTILVVAVLTVLVYVYLNYSKHGYEIAVVGESERTARYVGIKVGKVIVRTMLLSGALRRSLSQMVGVVEAISLGNFQRRGTHLIHLAQAVIDHRVHTPGHTQAPRGVQVRRQVLGGSDIFARQDARSGKIL